MLPLKFFIHIILPPHSGPGVYSISNRKEFHECLVEDKGGQYIGLTALPTSRVDCLEI
jgi:hypothetical protein